MNKEHAFGLAATMAQEIPGTYVQRFVVTNGEYAIIITLPDGTEATIGGPHTWADVRDGYNATIEFRARQQ